MRIERQRVRERLKVRMGFVPKCNEGNETVTTAVAVTVCEATTARAVYTAGGDEVNRRKRKRDRLK